MFTKQLYLILLLFAALAGNSFGQKRPKIDFDKKIADATPAALPQEPSPARPSTDARDKNLKGKVKTVTESSLEGKDRFQGGSDLYDPTGNLLKTISYDDNYPRSVTVFGYIDGKRVSRSRDVAYAPGEKPKDKGMELIQALGNPDPPGDKGYDVRMEYEYDASHRLTSATTYVNSNRLFSKHTYTYGGNERDVRDHDSEGNEISRTVEILDKDGNVIEERSYDADGKYSVRVTTYEYDSQGNWTVQKTFDVDDKKNRKLAWTTFRSITYY